MWVQLARVERAERMGVDHSVIKRNVMECELPDVSVINPKSLNVCTAC